MKDHVMNIGCGCDMKNLVLLLNNVCDTADKCVPNLHTQNVNC